MIIRAANRLDCPADCAAGCPVCILQPDLSQKDLALDRRGALDHARVLAQRLRLPDSLKVWGEASRYLGGGLVQHIDAMRRAGSLSRLVLYLHGAPSDWDLPEWPMGRRLTDRTWPDSPDGSATDEPAIWTGRLTCEEVMTHFLDTGELALAYHLAELPEERGLRPPVASGLLKSLVASEVLSGSYDAVAQTLGEWLAAAMSEVEQAEAAGPAASLRARSVALAALLRPALMARDTNARDHLGNLSLADGLSSFAPVAALLRDLRRDLQPSLAELRDLAGGEKLRRLPAALAAVVEWLPGARNAQIKHAPTNSILHKFLDSQGDMGSLFEAAIVGRVEPLNEASGLLLAISTDKRVAEDMVAAAERDIGRPKRDAIRGMALDWIVRKLREGADLLLDWRAAFLEEQAVDDQRKATLERFVNELRKELTRARRESPADEGIDAAVQRLLDETISDMLSVVEGRTAHGPHGATRLSEALDSALLRLPGHCQPLAPNEPAFDSERHAQRQALYLALQRPDSVISDEVDALGAHLGSHAVLPAQALIDRLERQSRLTPEETVARRFDLENARHSAREGARREIAGLRHDLEPLQSIDLVTSPEIQLWLDRFGVIEGALEAEDGICLPMREGQRSPAIPPDFPHLVQVLSEARDLRDCVRDGIRFDQRRRLDALAAKLRTRGDERLASEAGLVSTSLKQTVLLIDETQVLYLTTGGNWMQRLFACAAPFGYLQPYTTSPGNIPVEMFFGRESEISKIEGATSDGCLVYGGRQLGKSALLHHVRKRFHKPPTGRHAYYLKIDEFGGQVHPATQIWSEIRRALSADHIVPKSSEKPEDIRLGILDWLAKGGERRILPLVDEADMFLASEARSGFPNLNSLRV